MNQLRSPFDYKFSVTKIEGYSDIPNLFGEVTHVISNSSDHLVYVIRSERDIKLVGERFLLNRSTNYGYKTYETPLKSFDIIEHENDHKAVVLNSTISFPDLAEFELDLQEEITVTDHRHGTLYLPTKIIDAIRLTITINRVFDRGRLGSYVFSNDLENWLKPERYRVYINPEDDQILSMIKEDFNGEAESVLFRSEGGNRPKFNSEAQDQFTVYPTVSYGDVGVEFYGFSPATYRLEVYSILGTKMWSKSYFVDGNASFSADLSFLPKGNYQYSLIDPDGYRILSKRLGIIKY